jgi:hypothetical protein
MTVRCSNVKTAWRAGRGSARRHTGRSARAHQRHSLLRNLLRQGVRFPGMSLRPDVGLTFASTFSSEMGETSEKATINTSVCG